MRGNTRKGKPMAKGYSEAGASVSRRALKGFIPASSSPHEDIDFNNRTLRMRSRMLYMGAPVATSAINTNRTKVIGVGLSLSPTVDAETLGITAEAAKAWQKRTQKEFQLWAGGKRSCDAIGVCNFSSMQQLALKSWLMSGDVFALIKRQPRTQLEPYSLRIHLIEADRVCNPYSVNAPLWPAITEARIPPGQPGEGHRVFDGVEIDDGGRIVAYHICNVYPQQSLIGKAEWTRVTAYGARTGAPNVLQIMEAERPDSYRGVPYLAQVIEPLLQGRRYTEAELMAAIVQAFFTAWIETETDTTDIPINETGGGMLGGAPAESPPTDDLTESENEYELGPGTVTHLAPGEKIVFGNPNIPTAGFETFEKALFKQVGAALEIPYEVLIKEFTSSYSASRAALLEAWEAFRMRRQWFVDQFCQPIYELWLAEAVALGRVSAPGFFDDPLLRAAWCQAKWIGPVQGQLDPKKEVESALAMASSGIKTYEQITRELGGGDWADNMERVIDEKKKLAEGSRIFTEASAAEEPPAGGEGEE